MRRRHLLPLTALVLAAACSSGSGKAVLEQDPGAAVRASVEKADDTSSKLELTIRTEAAGQSFAITGKGAFEGKVGTMTMSLAGMTLEQRLTGGKLYVQLSNKPGWYVIDLADVVGTPLADTASPGDSAKVLLAADNDVTKVGTETVRGAETTHYRGRISLDAEHLDKLGGIAKASVQKVLDGGLTAIPFDVWLDDEGRLVKLVQDLTIGVEGTSAHLVSTLERYDFGTKVSVTPPPLSEQKDGAELLAAFKNGG